MNNAYSTTPDYGTFTDRDMRDQVIRSLGADSADFDVTALMIARVG